MLSYRWRMRMIKKPLRNRLTPVVTIFVFVLSFACDKERTRFPVLQGPYLGQAPPGADPELFAPNIVSTGLITRDVAITPDGDEIYFGVVAGNYTYSTIMGTRLIDGKWTEPEPVPFCRDIRYRYLEPALSPDGQHFYFVTNRPEDEDGDSDDWDIWAVDRLDEGWGDAYHLGAPVNSENGEYFPSITKDGTLYFSRSRPDRAHFIYRSRLVDGRYTEPERLGPNVNSTAGRQYNAFIAPDETYIIVPVFGREDGYGGTDYYIVFRNHEDVWSRPINLGEKINHPTGAEWSPYVSPDGRYFFFMASLVRPLDPEMGGRLTYAYLKDLYTQPRNGNASIYWVDASFINPLKPEGF